MPRFSVLLPTHNRADVIPFAIESVLRQTEPDFELLVAGDGCTDGTAAAVAAFRDDRIRWFDLPKAPGFGYANRNIALREARGDLVAFAAHDDLLFPDHLERLGQAIDEADADWLYSQPLWVTTDGIVIPYGPNLTLDDELTFFLTRGNSIAAACVVHRRHCLERYGYWPEALPRGGDWDLWVRIVSGSPRKPAYLPTPTCVHFTANWKRSRDGQGGPVRAMVQIADRSAWWPSGLKYTVPPGEPEQAVIFRAMTNEGADWCRQVRADVITVMDRVAREQVVRSLTWRDPRWWLRAPKRLVMGEQQ
ncbi:MAG: glycosyltransferase family 2 protein [Vicinamibacterales bacterium]